MRNRGLGRRAAAALALILCLAFAGQAAFGALERRVDLDLVDAELADVFRALAELGDMNIVLDPAVRGTLTIRLHGLAVEDALRLVAYTTGVKYRVEGSTMIVLPPGAVSTSLEPLGIEKFSLTYARTTDVIGPARLVAGGAKLEADERTNSIIACGSAEELRAIGDVLRMLDVPVQLPPEAIASLADAGLSSGRESLEIIRLQHAPAQGVADLLALVVPADRMRVDSRTNTIVVIIDEASRERAMKIVSEVDVAEPPDDGGFSSVPGKGVNLQTEAVEAETVKVIKLAWAPVDRVREALSVIIDLSKVGMDSRTNSLIVNATPEQIARIEEVVTLLDVAVVAGEKQPAPAHDGIHMFKLEHASAKSVRDVLTMILPPEKMQVDERTNTVVIMADDDTCARVVELVETLDVETAADQALIGEEKIVETIPLAHASLDAIRDALALVVPKEAVVIDERTRSVIVKGTRSQRERAREIAALLDVPDGPLHETGAATDPSSEPTTNIRAFRLREADPESVKEALSMVMPKTSIYVDARTKSVLVVGLLDELARAAEIVALIDQPSRDDVSVGLAKGESEILEMRVIRLVHAPAAKIRDMIAPIMPEIRIAADERSNSLLIVASPSLQERAASVVTALDIEVLQPEQGTEPAAPRDPEVTRVVTLANAEAAEVREALAPIVPVSSITVDPRTNSLVIVAAQSRMDRALDVVAKLDVETAASSESLPEEAAHVSESPRAEVVRLKYASPSKVRDALAPTIPVSRISVDERTGSLVIVGTEAEMTQALAIIDKLDIEVLQPEQGTEPAAPRDPEVTRVVTLAHAEAAEVREALAPIVPISSITVDPRTNSLVIVAAQSRMDRALDVVAKLDVETVASSESLPEEAAHVSESPKAEVVRLKYASPSKVRDALAPTIPVSRISVDERTGSLVIVGTEAEMTQALAIIDKLDIEVLQPEQGTEPAAPRDPEVTRVVMLAHAEAAEVREALAPIVPISSITVDPRTNSLVIVAAQSRMDRALEVVGKLDIEVGNCRGGA